ncbi:MAG TPA: signal peptide peptidase SppA [Bacteroidota bacterium]|nr:signal peptide peptidase SppA [Bacteroidota bacterium]
MTRTSKWVFGIISVLLILFVVVVFSFMYYLFSGDENEEVATGSNGTIALIELKEPIESSENTVRLFKKYRENSSVKAIVFRVESPGGGVAASQEIYEEVRKTRDGGKPVVVSMGSVAASGGYYVSCGASKIVANPGTVTGSIGVISQFVHITGLMDKIGISSTTIKSGKLKDAGSPMRQPTEEDKKYFQEMIDDVYGQFVGVVASERKLDLEVVKKLADGRVYTGKKAFELGLIDTLGTYEDAIALAGRLAGIKGTPTTIREKKKERLSDMLFGSVKNEITGLKNELVKQPLLQYSLTQP